MQKKIQLNKVTKVKAKPLQLSNQNIKIIQRTKTYSEMIKIFNKLNREYLILGIKSDPKKLALDFILKLQNDGFTQPEIDAVANYISDHSRIFKINIIYDFFLSETAYSKSEYFATLDCLKEMTNYLDQNLNIKGNVEKAAFLKKMFSSSELLEYKKFYVVSKILKRYGINRFMTKYLSGFSNTQINDAFSSIKGKTRVRETVKIPHRYGGWHLDSAQFYNDGYIYRLIPRRKYVIWEKLLSKGLLVEEFETTGFTEKLNFIKKQFNNGNLDSEKIKKHIMGRSKLVKSKNAGITIHELSEKQLLQNLPESTKIIIAKQICKTISAIWENGYLHNHLHSKNVCVDLNTNPPTARIIDFDAIGKITDIKLARIHGNSLQLEFKKTLHIIKSMSINAKYEKLLVDYIYRSAKTVSEKIGNDETAMVAINEYHAEYLNGGIT